MKTSSFMGRAVAVVLLLATAVMARGHCDSMDGPVVKAAKQALTENNVNVALAWVHKFDEADIRTAFTKTMVVRKLSPAARELADQYFFETLVRVHRAGEGEPYNGLKQAGMAGVAARAADKAIDSGDIKPLRGILSEELGRGLQNSFQSVQAKKYFDKNDVKAGREFVREYGRFMNYVEGVHLAVSGGTESSEVTIGAINTENLYSAFRVQYSADR